MKILVLRFSSIGDIILTTPVIRTLKTQKEQTEVHFATKKIYEELLSENPYVDKIHTLDRSLSHLIDTLRKENFDLIIDLHHNLRTKILKARLGIKSHSSNKLNFRKWLLTRFKINVLPNKHLVDRYMETLSPLKIKMDSLGLDYFIPEKDEVEVSWLPEAFSKPFAVFAIGASKNTKKLPKNKIIELCDKINQPVILLGNKDDQAIGEEVEAFFAQADAPDEYSKGLQELGKKTIVYNACGKFNIHQTASLIRQSTWMFTHDSGLMHIGAAFKKQLFTIWGNTIPEFGMYPYRTKFTIFENKKLGCRPCSKIGHSRCPKKHFKCMNELQFDFYLPG